MMFAYVHKEPANNIIKLRSMLTTILKQQLPHSTHTPAIHYAAPNQKPPAWLPASLLLNGDGEIHVKDPIAYWGWPK